VRTRPGYYARPSQSPTLPAYELPLREALAAAADSHDLPVVAGVAPSDAAAGGDSVVLVRVPLSAVRLASDEAVGVFRAHLSLFGRIEGEAGRVATRLTRDWPLEGSLDGKDEALRRDAVFRLATRLGPGRYSLAVAVQDLGSGAIGVARSAFEVKEPLPR